MPAKCKRRSKSKKLHNPTMLAVKRAARAMGVVWAEVCEERDTLKSAEREKRDHTEEARQIAWGRFGGHPSFWRNGFQRRFGRKLANGADYMCVPNHDLIAESVRQYLPEFTEATDQEIWDLLLSPYVPRTSVDAWYELALANVIAGRAAAQVASVSSPENTPF